MNAEQLNAIKERTEKATSGPWYWSTDSGDSLESDEAYVLSATSDWHIDGRYSNKEFIAHAREDIPALVAEVERLRSVIWRISNIYDISMAETLEYLGDDDSND